MKYYIFGENSVGIAYGDNIPDGAVECSEDIYRNSAGFSVANGALIAPSDDDLDAIAHAAMVAVADTQKATLRAEADKVITPLRDAVDLGMVTDDEAAKLTKWTKYRVLLNRIDTSTAPNIVWPEIPES